MWNSDHFAQANQNKPVDKITQICYMYKAQNEIYCAK